MKKKILIISVFCLAMCMGVFAAENPETAGAETDTAKTQIQEGETKREGMRGGGEMRGMPPKGDENGGGFRERGGEEPPRTQENQQSGNNENSESVPKSDGGQNSGMTANENKITADGTEETSENGGEESFGERPQMNEPRGFEGENMQTRPNNANLQQEKSFWETVKEYSAPILSVVLLALAFVFVKLYKRRMY